MARLNSPSHSGPPLLLNRRQSPGNNTLKCPSSRRVETLVNCNKLDELLIRCNNLQGNVPKQEYTDCFCSQGMLNAFIGCKNDLRLCSLSYAFDSDYDILISDWNTACRPHFTGTRSTPTTAPDIPLTQTINLDSCQTLLVSCYKLDTTFSSCSSSSTRSADWSQCMCRSDVLALASECEIDGALECLRTTPNPAALWGAVYCSVTPSIPVNRPTVTITSPGGTVPSITFGPTASSTTSSGGGVIMAPVMSLVSMILFLLAFVQV